MTTKRIAELREWADKLKEGEWDGDAENAREAVDEIERLQKQVERDAGARALWDAHFGDHTPQPESTLTVTRTGSPDESLGWTDVVFTTGEKP